MRLAICFIKKPQVRELANSVDKVMGQNNGRLMYSAKQKLYNRFFKFALWVYLK